jgi:hypothetical protein
MPAPKDPIKRALWVERMSKVRTGKKKPPASEEQKRKQSEAMKGKMVGERNPMYGIHLTGDQNPMFGKHHTDEVKQKISNTKKGQSVKKERPTRLTRSSPEYLENQRIKHLKENLSEETIAKMSVAKKGKPLSDEYKEKRRTIMLETWSDPEHRARMSEQHLGEKNPNFGKQLPESQKQYLSELASQRTGDKNPNWNGGVTVFRQLIRGLKKYKAWCRDIYKKEEYKDRFSGKIGTTRTLIVHHIIPLNMVLKICNVKTFDDVYACQLLWNTDNGILMEPRAHDKFHNLYGDDKNIYELTQEQIAELYTQ